MQHTFARSVPASSLALLWLLAGCGTPAPATDAGAADTGSVVEDSGGTVDAASPVDSGPTGPCPVTFAGCTALDDHTGEPRVDVGFAAAGFVYEPRCIRVSAGTVVSIAASSLHPIRSATCSPSDTEIPSTPSSASGDYTFATAGVYGYFCNAHGTNAGNGMAGLIVVE